MRTDGLCRCGCGNKAKRSWACKRCMDRSVEAFKIQKGDAGAIRAVVFRRDKGVCAACGMDTEAERMKCWQHEFRELRTRYFTKGFPPPARTWWECDHRQEVVRGGGAGCGLDNFQSLCVACHKTKTRNLARARASERRGGKACTGPDRLR